MNISENQEDLRPTGVEKIPARFFPPTGTIYDHVFSQDGAMPPMDPAPDPKAISKLIERMATD